MSGNLKLTVPGLRPRPGRETSPNEESLPRLKAVAPAAPVTEESRGVNVKVIVRCRPVNDIEKKDPSQHQVISARSESKEIFVSQTMPGRKTESYSKTFTFDGVCNQFATQLHLFNVYVVPIVEEVLQGFNCTIFAYGQTGTGKTYTMEGDFYASNSQSVKPAESSQDPMSPLRVSPSSSGVAAPLVLSDCAGIIPRSVQYIFDKLDVQEAEYSVRVSYLEIYNEELNDLLNAGEKQNLRIYEDPNVKRGLAVDRLEEVPVNNPQDILNVLSIAVRKRKTAETLLNHQSSRSHCIFSVTIHMKETNLNGEDIIKIGKLNLVDLAGSENIQRSGANTIKDRAKEAGMINQSLLTLGRVINALVEHASYIPYRDSKLTRLLQDSLGGRTKTCIIATISPSSLCLEETLSTLDYAHRAKNIRNRPEINQRMTKRVMIRGLNREIERLKTELLANREKNGVYLPLERYTEMESQLASQGSELSDLISEIERLQRENAQCTSQLSELQTVYEQECSHRQTAEKDLKEAQETNARLRLQVETTQAALDSERTLRHQVETTDALLRQRYASLCEHFSSALVLFNRLRSTSFSSQVSGQTLVEVTGGILDTALHTVFDRIKPHHLQFVEALETTVRKLDQDWDHFQVSTLHECKHQTQLAFEQGAARLKQSWAQFEDMCSTQTDVVEELVHQISRQVASCLAKQLSDMSLGYQKASEVAETLSGHLQELQGFSVQCSKTLEHLCSEHQKVVEASASNWVEAIQPQLKQQVDDHHSKVQQEFASLKEHTAQCRSEQEELTLKAASLILEFSKEFNRLQSAQTQLLDHLSDRCEASERSLLQHQAVHTESVDLLVFHKGAGCIAACSEAAKTLQLDVASQVGGPLRNCSVRKEVAEALHLHIEDLRGRTRANQVHLKSLIDEASKQTQETVRTGIASLQSCSEQCRSEVSEQQNKTQLKTTAFLDEVNQIIASSRPRLQELDASQLAYGQHVESAMSAFKTSIEQCRERTAQQKHVLDTLCGQIPSQPSMVSSAITALPIFQHDAAGDAPRLTWTVPEHPQVDPSIVDPNANSDLPGSLAQVTEVAGEWLTEKASFGVKRSAPYLATLSTMTSHDMLEGHESPRDLPSPEDGEDENLVPTSVSQAKSTPRQLRPTTMKPRIKMNSSAESLLRDQGARFKVSPGYKEASWKSTETLAQVPDLSPRQINDRGLEAWGKGDQSSSQRVGADISTATSKIPRNHLARRRAINDILPLDASPRPDDQGVSPIKAVKNLVSSEGPNDSRNNAVMDRTHRLRSCMRPTDSKIRRN